MLDHANRVIPDHPEITGIHPLAGRYRLISDAELQDLVSDIQVDGFDARFPVILDGSILIDGRNRLRACVLAGVTPVFRQFDDDWHGEPEDKEDALKRFILRANNNRRHQNAGQRAIMVAIAYPTPTPGKEPTSLEVKEVNSGVLSQARTIVNSAPDLIGQVIEGGMYFKTAFEEARRRREETEKVEAFMRRLENEAPDLHAIVLEEKGMTASEAISALDKRLENQASERAENERRERERAAEARAVKERRTAQICEALAFFNPRKVEPSVMAQALFKEIDLELWPKNGMAKATPECWRACLKTLEGLIELMESAS